MWRPHGAMVGRRGRGGGGYSRKRIVWPSVVCAARLYGVRRYYIRIIVIIIFNNNGTGRRLCAKTCAAPRCVPASRRASAGACVFVRSFLFWGTAGVALKTAPDDVGSGPRRGNGFWFDKRPTGDGRPIHAKTRTVRFYISSSANFFSTLPRAISFYFPSTPPPIDFSTRCLQIDFSRRCLNPTYIIYMYNTILLFMIYILYLCTNVTAPLLILCYV